MKIRTKYFYGLIFFFLLSITLDVFGQDSATTRKMELNVLSRNKLGKIFSFNVSKYKDERNIVQLRYVGNLETKAHIIYKILTWARIWGPNYHTTGVILLYDINNVFVGKYLLGDMTDLPSKVERNNLIFFNKEKINCDSTIVTKIDFSKGIPNEIFLKCKGEFGDIYTFSNESK